MLVPLCIVIYFSASDKGDGHVVDQTWCVDPLAHAPRAHAHVHPRTCTLARASSHAHPRACILARAHPRKRTLARASSRVHPLMRIACARPAHRFEADGLVQPVFILCVANWATEALKAVMPAPILQRCVLSRLLSPSSAVSHLLLPAFTFLGRLSPSIRYVLSRLVFSQQKLNRTYEPPPFNLGLLYSQAVKTVALGASHRARIAAHSVHSATRARCTTQAVAPCCALQVALGLIFGPIYPIAYLLTAIGLLIAWYGTQPHARCSNPSAFTTRCTTHATDWCV